MTLTLFNPAGGAPPEMRPSIGLPTDRSELHPWVAGLGEEHEGRAAGQIPYKDRGPADDFTRADPGEIVGWERASVLYHAMNGDAVLIDRSGKTTWHVMETGDLVPIADTFLEFIKQYASFRERFEIFESWSWREIVAASED